MENIEIRVADENDLQALVEVGDELFDHQIKPDRANEFFEDPRHHMVIALDGPKVVGFASGMHYIHPDKEPHFFINEIGVLEKYRNHGIARAIVKFIVDYAKSLNCVEAWIATETSNRPAIHAYLAAGGIEDADEAVIILWENLDM